MIEEILGVLVTLSSKKNDKKSNIANAYKSGLENFDQEIKGFMRDRVMGFIYNYDTITNLLIQTS